MGFRLRLLCVLHERVDGTGLCESRRAKQTAVAVATRCPELDRIVTAVGQTIVEAEFEAAPDDLGLRHVDERRVNPETSALDAGARGQGRHMLERANEVRAAVRVARIVQ